METRAKRNLVSAEEQLNKSVNSTVESLKSSIQTLATLVSILGGRNEMPKE